jgi:hypothetical protein
VKNRDLVCLPAIFRFKGLNEVLMFTLLTIFALVYDYYFCYFLQLLCFFHLVHIIAASANVKKQGFVLVGNARDYDIYKN